MALNRGDAHVFISSIHIILAQLRDVEEKKNVEIPDSVYAELSAMEAVLSRDYLNK